MIALLMYSISRRHNTYSVTSEIDKSDELDLSSRSDSVKRLGCSSSRECRASESAPTCSSELGFSHNVQTCISLSFYVEDSDLCLKMHSYDLHGAAGLSNLANSS